MPVALRVERGKVALRLHRRLDPEQRDAISAISQPELRPVRAPHRAEGGEARHVAEHVEAQRARARGEQAAHEGRRAPRGVGSALDDDQQGRPRLVPGFARHRHARRARRARRARLRVLRHLTHSRPLSGSSRVRVRLRVTSAAGEGAASRVALLRVGS